MFTRMVAAVLLAAAPASAFAQSRSAPLAVTATVVSSCKVDVPRAADMRSLASLPVALTCARRGATPRVQRPQPARRAEAQAAVVRIDF